MTDPEKCPCGSTKLLMHSTSDLHPGWRTHGLSFTTFFVVCLACHRRGRLGDTPGEAIEKWNAGGTQTPVGVS